jgi:hypothetical protein
LEEDMDKILEPLTRASDFLRRYPNLDGSRVLNKEAAALVKALNKYNDKAAELELSLTPYYAETAAILEADGKPLVTPDFIRGFTGKYCSKTLSVSKVNKKEREALLKLAARDGKLQILRTQLDPTRKYREMFQRLLSESEDVIKQKILSMKAADFQGIVKGVGLDAPQTKAGAVSTSKGSKEAVLKQIFHVKRSDELMEDLTND